jgi:hypothetical protein
MRRRFCAIGGSRGNGAAREPWALVSTDLNVQRSALAKNKLNVTAKPHSAA